MQRNSTRKFHAIVYHLKNNETFSIPIEKSEEDKVLQKKENGHCQLFAIQFNDEFQLVTLLSTAVRLRNLKINDLNTNLNLKLRQKQKCTVKVSDKMVYYQYGNCQFNRIVFTSDIPRFMSTEYWTISEAQSNHASSSMLTKKRMLDETNKQHQLLLQAHQQSYQPLDWQVLPFNNEQAEAPTPVKPPIRQEPITWQKIQMSIQARNLNQPVLIPSTQQLNNLEVQENTQKKLKTKTSHRYNNNIHLNQNNQDQNRFIAQNQANDVETQRSQHFMLPTNVSNVPCTLFSGQKTIVLQKNEVTKVLDVVKEVENNKKVENLNEVMQSNFYDDLSFEESIRNTF